MPAGSEVVVTRQRDVGVAGGGSAGVAGMAAGGGGSAGVGSSGGGVAATMQRFAVIHVAGSTQEVESVHTSRA